MVVHGVLLEYLRSVPWGRIPDLATLADNTTDYGKKVLEVGSN
jgi:hypothetical protein